MDQPIAYLVRVGSVDQSSPFLSDPSLSEQGVMQAQAVCEWMAYRGAGLVKAQTTLAAKQFADLISAWGSQVRNGIPIFVLDTPEVQTVKPGGVVAVYGDENAREYRAVFGEQCS